MRFEDICRSLPSEPIDCNGRLSFWATDDEILCETEESANIIADFLENMGYDCVTTGYYDPEEDKRHGEVDRFTGFYYVTV